MCIVICTLLLSRPARGAWIEILSKLMIMLFFSYVAPRKGRVD